MVHGDSVDLENLECTDAFPFARSPGPGTSQGQAFGVMADLQATSSSACSIETFSKLVPTDPEEYRLKSFSRLAGRDGIKFNTQVFEFILKQKFHFMKF